MAFVNTDWNDWLYDDSTIGISSAMKESILDDSTEQEKDYELVIVAAMEKLKEVEK
jgi:hypothetical protein